MPLLLSLCPMARFSCVSQFRVHDLAFQETSSRQPCITPRKVSFVNQKLARVLENKPPSLKKMTRHCMNSRNELRDEEMMDQSHKFDLDSPWEGAVMYQRNSSVQHVEYCTTLERLGLKKVSSEVSKSRASLMGLRVTKSVKDFPSGTPVLISVDVTRKKGRLRLDGILRTVITLDCYRCGVCTGESLFLDFSLLLTEDPIEEPEIIDMGVLSGENNSRTNAVNDDDIDLDDWIYFPPQQKVVDISKHFRDMIHLQITLNGLCDPNCKGSCLSCGTNLNVSNCICRQNKGDGKGFGPIRVENEDDM